MNGPAISPDRNRGVPGESSGNFLGASIESECRDVPAVARHWREQWLAFPTVDCDQNGGWSYWCVPADTGCYEDDWPVGERLASETLKQIRRFPEGSAVLRRLLREIDHDSIVGQGFLSRLEDTIAYPEVYEPDVPSRIANDVTLDHPTD